MTTFAVSGSFHGNRASIGQPCQLFEVRLRYLTRLLSRTPGFPLMMLQESSSSPTVQAFFSLPLLDNSFAFETHLVHSLASLNIPAATCELMASKITEFSAQFTAGNTELTQFSIIANIDSIQSYYCDDNSPVPLVRNDGERYVDQTIILESVTTERRKTVPVSVSKSAIEKLRKRKRIEGEEGDCSVCYEEFRRKKVIRMQCEHVFHESCIIRWLKKNNSCPLCRRPVEDS